ncbi:hypothetical protein P7K49_033066 [Saguinus oedipus]|uniref:Uncharacterized protein n=1 Tax=Saguinus oedipus TaxID=9490 RepID=A0ABQ9TR78_SAGOE|nr:hypothetical protein P7K49_033066 [Saguinus oedipus]
MITNTAITYAKYSGSNYRDSCHLLTYIEYHEECPGAAKAFLKVPPEGPRLRASPAPTAPARLPCTHLPALARHLFRRLRQRIAPGPCCPSPRAPVRLSCPPLRPTCFCACAPFQGLLPPPTPRLLRLRATLSPAPRRACVVLLSRNHHLFDTAGKYLKTGGNSQDEWFCEQGRLGLERFHNVGITDLNSKEWVIVSTGAMMAGGGNAKVSREHMKEARESHKGMQELKNATSDAVSNK